MATSSQYPPFMQNSHDDGSNAAIQVLLGFICMWEVLYRLMGYLMRKELTRYPKQILDSSLLKEEGKSSDTNGNGINLSSPLGDAMHTLIQRGPSYAVSLLHSTYVTGRGVMHIYNLWDASNFDKLVIPGIEVMDSYRWAHLQVATTNTLFSAYLVYDLFHILGQYPRLGGVDTILHHVLFACCSFINGTYGLMAFQFGWLAVGELSTVFLNIRWFMLKSGREKSALLNKINVLFAAMFFLTRIGIYTAGIVHLFFYSATELQSLPDQSGVPIPLLIMTCGCMLVGWALNTVWGYKILQMMGSKPKKIKEN